MGTGEVGVELADGAAVEPVVGAEAGAYVAREALVVVGGEEGEAELVVVGRVHHVQGHLGAQGMQVHVARSAVVREPVAAPATRVAVEVAFRVGGAGEEGERVRRVGGVVDEGRQLRAIYVQGVVTCTARVYVAMTSGGQVLLASGTRREGSRGGEVHGVEVAEVLDTRLATQLSHVDRSMFPTS